MSVDRIAIEENVRTLGFAIIEDVVDEATTGRLRAAIDGLRDREEIRRKGGVYGIRNLLGVLPEAVDLAMSSEIRAVVEPILGPDAFAVRGTMFDKIPAANWKLGWHQDGAITVKEPRIHPGFEGFATKAGVWHVQPPAEILATMLAVRVHLDDCDERNGPLRVLPGSHCHGWLDDDLASWKRRIDPVACTVRAGGVVLMRPLLLHASSASASPSHRRVLHIEYAAHPLPGGLQWHVQLGP